MRILSASRSFLFFIRNSFTTYIRILIRDFHLKTRLKVEKKDWFIINLLYRDIPFGYFISQFISCNSAERRDSKESGKFSPGYCNFLIEILHLNISTDEGGGVMNFVQWRAAFDSERMITFANF